MEMYNNNHGDDYKEVASLLRAAGSIRVKNPEIQRSDASSNEALVAVPTSPSNSKEEWLINDMPTTRKKRKTSHEFSFVSRKRSCDSITNEGDYPYYSDEGMHPTEEETRDNFDNDVFTGGPVCDVVVTSSNQLNCIRVMVKVEGHTFLVPCDPSSTIGWLCSVVAQRYAALDGRHPQMNLTNQKGAMLASEDLVAAVVNNEECVDGHVISWTTPPLVDVYTNTSGGNVNSLVVQKLKSVSSSSHMIDLSNCSIRASHLTTIVKCLVHQSSLKSLSLRGNRLNYYSNMYGTTSSVLHGED